MDSLPMNSSGQVNCPHCKGWNFADHCAETVQLLGVGAKPCGASVCPSCGKRMMPEKCPLNRSGCPSNP